MTDSLRLKKTIKASGLKKKFIADQLGVSYSGYLSKENGITEFYASEISIIKGLLNLSDEEVTMIFFS